MRRPASAGGTLLVLGSAVVLALSACSGGSSSATGTGSSASRSGTASGSPTASATAQQKLDLRVSVGKVQALPAVSGYRYTTPSSVALDRVARLSQQYDQVSTGRVVRGVLKGGKRIGDVAQVALGAKYTTSGMFQGQIVNAIATAMVGSGAKVSYDHVGETGVEIAANSTTVALAWLQGSTVIVVVTSKANQAAGRAYATAYPREH